MQRLVFFAYGVLCHVMFLGVYLALACFVAGVGLVPTIDGACRFAGGAKGTCPASPTGTDFGAALLVDAGLLMLFAVQHSVMARPGFKAVFTRIVPKAVERSTYVLISNLLVMLLIWQWRPLPASVWELPAGPAWWGVFALGAAGWLLVPAASLMINHFDLFGTRQVWANLQGREAPPLPFRTPWLYRFVRHPLYVGWLIAFWAAPVMTVGHLLFAGFLTGYILVAMVFEERDLVAHYGRQYEEYRRNVPALVPGWGGGRASDSDGAKSKAAAEGVVAAAK